MEIEVTSLHQTIMSTPAFAFGTGITPSESFVLLEHIIEDRGSRYSVSYGQVNSREEIKQFLVTLKASKEYRKADHHSYAARIEHEGVIFVTKSDDGESGAGQVILRLLEKHDLRNGIVVVTRWFGGVKLMGDRFKHIQDATHIAIDHMVHQ
jgi:putative IMPACT (imprinted ancient) family translation regulator